MTDYPARDASDIPSTPAVEEFEEFEEFEATLPRLPRVDAIATAEAPSAAPAPSSYHIPWRPIIRDALILWAGTRFIYLAFTYLAAGLSQAQPAQGTGFFGLWQRFDTNWYLSIATQGYAFPQQVAFFPLYPALIRLFSLFTGGNMLVSALIVGNLGTLAALIALGALTAWETRDGATPASAMLLMLAFPFAFFFATAYTEGMFLAFAIFCLLFARRGQWGYAALFALLAGATRPTGVVLIPPLAWEWLRQNGLTDLDFWRARLRQRDVAAVWIVIQRAWKALRTSWIGLLSLIAVPAFYLAFVVFVGIRFKHPSLVLRVHRDYWGIDSAPVWKTAYREITHIFIAPFASSAQTIMVLDTVTFLVVAALVVLFWRSMPGLYNLYMLALLYLSIAQPAIVALQVLQSTGRFLLP
ncbi:MAG TPA: mannosyltransferase family protein, partial [Ktedonobacterales bacterium]|nr:mannosyltransferase family protein [Ktedonobacterales bacterium]